MGTWLPEGTTTPPNMDGAPPGYFDRCLVPRHRGPNTCVAPGYVLRGAVEGQQVLNVTALRVEAAGMPAIAATPFLTGAAPPSRLNATMFIETIAGTNGTLTQLQYMQAVDLAFKPRFDCKMDNTTASCRDQPTILWPHVTVAS